MSDEVNQAIITNQMTNTYKKNITYIESNDTTKSLIANNNKS